MTGKNKNQRLEAQKFIAQNRRATFDYHIKETFEAGLVLQGTEVKSLRLGGASIQEAHAAEKGGRIWIFNMNIGEYGKAGRHLQHEATRPRELLLKKRQISKLIGAVKREGYTLVPLSLYFNARGLAKLDLGLGKGKNKVDKRASEKAKDWKKEKGRLIRDLG